MLVFTFIIFFMLLETSIYNYMKKGFCVSLKNNYFYLKNQKFLELSLHKNVSQTVFTNFIFEVSD